jgi:large subunit ribosomal protein L25
MTIKLKAKKRNLKETKAKKLRREGILPANIYGKNIKSESIMIPLTDFNKAFKKAGETSLIEIELGKDKRTVLISDIQTDPVTDIPLHADFKQVNLKEKVTATVPVELTGEAPAEVKGVGTLVQQVSELEVEAFPLDLPEKLIGDVSKLEEVESRILLSDLKYDHGKVGVEAADDLIIAIIQPPQKEEEVVVPSAGTEEQEEQEEVPETQKEEKQEESSES